MSQPENVYDLTSKQLTFDGVDVVGITDTLRSMKSKPTDKVRHHFEHVEGWFKGRVVDVRTPVKGEVTVERTQVIEVLDWGAE